MEAAAQLEVQRLSETLSKRKTRQKRKETNKTSVASCDLKKYDRSETNLDSIFTMDEEESRLKARTFSEVRSVERFRGNYKEQEDAEIKLGASDFKKSDCTETNLRYVDAICLP